MKLTHSLSWYPQVALFPGLACFKPGLDLNSTGTGLGIGLYSSKVVLLMGLVCARKYTHTYRYSPVLVPEKNTSVDK